MGKYSLNFGYLKLNLSYLNIEIFLKCKKFYCYDNVCFLPVLATLCGCIPILNNKYPGFENIRELYN